MQDSAVSPSSENQQAKGRRFPTYITAAGVLVLAPGLFAALTYQQDYTFLASRYLSAPILMAEFALIALAKVSGVRPLAVFRETSTLARTAMLVFIASITASAVMAGGEPSTAIGQYLITLLHGLLCLCLYGALISPWQGRGRLILTAAGGGVAVFAATVFALLFFSRDIAAFNWFNVGTGVSNVRHLGYFAAIAGGLGAGLLVTAQTRTEQAAAAAIFFAGAFLVFWNGGRAGMAAIVLVVLVALVLGSKAKALRNAGQIAALVALAAIISTLWVPPHPAWGISYAAEKVASGSGTMQELTSNRTVLWGEAWAGFLDRPLIGHGAGQFTWLVGMNHGGFNHPHNSVLQSLFQWGLIGTVGLAVLHLRALVGLKAAFARERHTAVPAVIGLVGLGAIAMLDGPLFYVYPAAIWVIMLTVLAASGSAAGRSERDVA